MISSQTLAIIIVGIHSSANYKAIEIYQLVLSLPSLFLCPSASNTHGHTLTPLLPH